MKELRDSMITISLLALILSGLWITIALISIQFDTPFGDTDKKNIIDNSPIERTTLSSQLYGGISFDVAKTDGYLDGYNLFNLHAINASKRSERINNSLVIFDMDGNLILENSWFINPIEMINSTTILGDSINGAVLWNMETDEYHFIGVRGHHEYEYNPNANTVFTLVRTFEEIDGDDYRFDEIHEYDLDGSLVWSLDVHDFIDYTQWCPYQDHKLDAGDITHSNSVFYDADEDSIILNVRNVNTFYKIDHATGEVIWALGEYGDFTLFDRFGRERTNLFYHSHSVEQIDDNRFIMFDNDFHNQTQEQSHKSRILEIEINETTMTARETWSWTGDLSYYSTWWGDADRLANGNRLGTFGAEVKVIGPYGARLVEVNNDGEIVWEMSFRNTDDVIYGVYRMERIRFSPILSSPPDVLVSYGSELDLSWDTWYNFRSKRTMHGTYDLYIDDSLVETGPVEYDKFWRPTEIDLNIGPLNLGDHNITLVVKDEGGHCTADTVNVSVRTFHVDRVGSLFTETGSLNSTIVWSGVTSYSVSFELSANGTTLQQDSWDETDIQLDIGTFSVGHYHIVLEFSNSSGTVYTDSFWVIVNPLASPEFLTTPNDISIDWNSTTTMSWSVFDHSPSEWFLYQNGVLNLSGSWNGGYHEIEWIVSDIDEGVYNITLVLQDVVSNVRSIATWLEIIPPSPPVLTEAPSSAIVKWARETLEYNWEVHGGTDWKLYRNGTVIKEGMKQEPTITLKIQDWQAAGWRLGNYNITLLVTDGSHSISNTIWLTVFVDFGDAYVNSVVTSRSAWYSDGESAIGVPDSEFASLFEDYGPGYLTLDMGENEEIVNEAGNDFQIVSSGGNYSVSISPDLDRPFIGLGVFSGTQSFDLSLTEYNVVRYIRIDLNSIEIVFIDAIVALNYDEQGSDSKIPRIKHLDPIEIWTNQTPYEIKWDIYDRTPWNYSIYVNNNLKFRGPWNGDAITFPFIQAPGSWEVRLVVFDLFGNNASSTTIVTLKFAQSHFLLTIIPSSGFLVIIVIVVYLLVVKESSRIKE